MRRDGVVRVEIHSRAPIQGTFGTAGAFELISGRYFGELDPHDPKNSVITDIALAPRNAAGRVEYSATFAMAKPVDMKKASGVLMYDVVNRGLALDLHSPDGPRIGVVNGDEDGHIHIVSGWQGDIAPSPLFHAASVPVARHADGSVITGPVLVRIVDPPAAARTVSLVTGIGNVTKNYEPATLETSQATLTRRRSDDEAGERVPPEQWAFADCREGAFPGKPDPHCISLRDGFDPAYAYELIYTAKNPLVLGIGFAAVRDLVAFLRDGDEASGNPIAGHVRWTIATGASQSGNFLRSFLNLGFNQSLANTKVFDGMNVLIAGRQALLNIRFGVPAGAAGLYEPGSEGVLWWDRTEDTVRGRPPAGLLDRCRATGTCPKIFEIFGSAEFWGLRMSPNLVGLDAKRDIPLPDNVRRYYFAGVTHGGGAGGFAREQPKAATSWFAANPNPMRESMRALFKAMVAWVVENKAPPDSRAPTLAASDLVRPDHEAMGFPAISGQPLPDGKINPMAVYDFGPRFEAECMSGILDQVPPRLVQTTPSLVPRVDADGNELSGILSVHVRVPLGTYLGWNVHTSGYYKGAGAGFLGGFLPFAATKAEREASGDPRLSLEERYGSHAGFVEKGKLAAQALIAEGFLLPADAQRIVAEAQASTILGGAKSA